MPEIYVKRDTKDWSRDFLKLAVQKKHNAKGLYCIRLNRYTKHQTIVLNGLFGL